jgi:hypothetical protein
VDGLLYHADILAEAVSDLGKPLFGMAIAVVFQCGTELEVLGVYA